MSRGFLFINPGSISFGHWRRARDRKFFSNLAFAHEDRRLVHFLFVCLWRCLWPDSDSVLNSESEEDVASLDVLELLLLENRDSDACDAFA